VQKDLVFKRCRIFGREKGGETDHDTGNVSLGMLKTILRARHGKGLKDDEEQAFKKLTITCLGLREQGGGSH